MIWHRITSWILNLNLNAWNRFKFTDMLSYLVLFDVKSMYQGGLLDIKELSCGWCQARVSCLTSRKSFWHYGLIFKQKLDEFLSVFNLLHVVFWIQHNNSFKLLFFDKLLNDAWIGGILAKMLGSVYHDVFWSIYSKTLCYKEMHRNLTLSIDILFAMTCLRS